MVTALKTMKLGQMESDWPGDWGGDIDAET